MGGLWGLGEFRRARCSQGLGLVASKGSGLLGFCLQTRESEPKFAGATKRE